MRPAAASGVKGKERARKIGLGSNLNESTHNYSAYQSYLGKNVAFNYGYHFSRLLNISQIAADVAQFREFGETRAFTDTNGKVRGNLQLCHTNQFQGRAM